MTAQTDKVLTKGEQAATDVSSLLRARNPLLWIVTKEEARVEGYLAEAAAAAGYLARVWDVAQGVADLAGKKVTDFTDPDPATTLKGIRERAENASLKDRGVWIMRDLAPWLGGPGGATTLRQLRNLARLLPGVDRARAQAIIVLSPTGNIPDELAGHATVIEWPLPDRTEIAAILDAAIEALPEYENGPNGEPDPTKPVRAVACTEGVRDAAIDAAIGLSGEEASACYARSLVTSRKIEPKLVANEKKRVIAREGVLEWYDPIPAGLEAVGGLENLKAWLLGRKSAYSAKAREYGLPAPKGAFVAGVSGCGKSLLAKATATAWGVPLLKLDLGALKGKFVGESEKNIRKAFRVIEAIGRCIVWIDEIEKALQGATGGGSADGGVSADALGTVLTWMQERAGEAFVIATANDISGLPPELLRKGRFDELWFVDLPTASERQSVLKAALTVHGRQNVKINLKAVAEATENFTGSEIAAIVPDALFAAFAEDAREITTADLIAAAKTVTPLSQTAKEKIADLRKWSATRARAATKPEAVTAAEKAVRRLDI